MDTAEKSGDTRDTRVFPTGQVVPFPLFLFFSPSLSFARRLLCVTRRGSGFDFIAPRIAGDILFFTTALRPPTSFVYFVAFARTGMEKNEKTRVQKCDPAKRPRLALFFVGL